MENQTILRLAQLDNIKAVKDCCAIPAQTAELLRVKPRGFSLLVGDDANFFSSVSLGAEGGILASAHINVEIYTRVLKLLREGKASSLDQARGEWNAFVDTISLVFGEPNPAPVKYMLSKQGLIASSEMRLPMTKTTPAMEAKLDAYLKR